MNKNDHKISNILRHTIGTALLFQKHSLVKFAVYKSCPSYQVYRVRDELRYGYESRKLINIEYSTVKTERENLLVNFP